MEKRRKRGRKERRKRRKGGEKVIEMCISGQIKGKGNCGGNVP